MSIDRYAKFISEQSRRLGLTEANKSGSHISVYHPGAYDEEGAYDSKGGLTKSAQTKADHYHAALDLLRKKNPKGFKTHDSYGQEDDVFTVEKGSPAHKLVSKHLSHIDQENVNSHDPYDHA